jgi:hypothetical protein
MFFKVIYFQLLPEVAMNEDSEMGGAEAMAVMDAVMPHYSEETPTHTPANQVGHAHSHSSQSGGVRPFTLQSTAGTLTLQPIRWETPFYATVNSWGHSHSSQSGGTCPFTLQSTVGTLTFQPIRWETPFYATVNSWQSWAHRSYKLSERSKAMSDR